MFVDPVTGLIVIVEDNSTGEYKKRGIEETSPFLDLHGQIVTLATSRQGLYIFKISIYVLNRGGTQVSRKLQRSFSTLGSIELTADALETILQK